MSVTIYALSSSPTSSNVPFSGIGPRRCVLSYSVHVLGLERTFTHPSTVQLFPNLDDIHDFEISGVLAKLVLQYRATEIFVHLKIWFNMP